MKKLAFTGSTATAKKVAALCAQSLTPVIAECGGKDPVIVARDADIAKAVDALLKDETVSNPETETFGCRIIYR